MSDKASDILRGIISGYEITETPIATGAGVTQLCQNNPNRWCVIITTTAGGLVTTSQNPLANSGIPINVNLPPLILTVRDHASLAQVPLFVHSAALALVTVIEVVKV